jgi:hypothetical protein
MQDASSRRRRSRVLASAVTRFGVSPGMAPRWDCFTSRIGRLVIVLSFFIVAFASAQESQFVFDPTGNLLLQTAATSSPPQIVRQPQMQVVQPGSLASFSVLALDTSGLSYQWLFNGATLPGQTGDALQVSNVSTNDQGYYSVLLANAFGSVTSSPAPLWIDSRGCGMPDWWQLQYFSNLTQNATADFDGDGVSNLQEFLDGSNPTNSASARFRLTLFSDGGVVQVFPNQSSYNTGDVVTLTATAIAPGAFHAWLGDVISRSNPVTLIMTTNKTIFARFTPIDFSFTNISGGDWGVASNWNPPLVPLSNDNVYITQGGNVTQSNAAECLSLFLGANNSQPNLSLSSTFTVHGPSVWGSGQLAGSGRLLIDTSASLLLTNQGTFSQGVIINACTLENGGTILFTGAGNIGGNGGVITNRAGALFESQGAGSLANFAGGYRFDNAGVYRKTVNPGTNGIGIPFNNYGTVDIETGTLVCSGTFTNTGTVTLAPGATNRFFVSSALSSGPFNVPAGALVELDSGTVTLVPGAQLNGGGLYRINGGGTMLANTDLSVSNLDLANVALDGAGTVTVNNVMNWTAGSMVGGGRTVISPGATLNIGNPNNNTLSRTLENGGTILWTGAGTLELSSGVITNRVGALFEQRGAGSFVNFNLPYRFDNSGIFRKTLDPGTNAARITFNNYGTVDIESGTLACTSTFTNTGTVTLAPGATNRFSVSSALSSGPFNVPAGALVELDSGTVTLAPGAQLNGGGLYRINGGTMLANTDLSVSNLALANVALDGSGTLTVNNVMNWTAGNMLGGGRTVISPGATLNVGNANNINLSRTLDNGGTIFWTGTDSLTLSSGIITNRPGGVFEGQNAAAFAAFFSPFRFDNAGIFRKSVSTGTTIVNVPFTNYGTVDLRLGVLAANNGFASSSNALFNCALGGTAAATNYGRLQVSGAVTLNGALSVALVNGYLPTTNDSFAVVTAGTRSGSFSSFSYPSNQVTMLLSNTANAVIVRVTGVTAPPPAPLLLTPLLSGDNVLLTWTAVSNILYRLEFNPELTPSNWTAVPGDMLGTGTNVSKLDPLTPSNRFYRVRVLP